MRKLLFSFLLVFPSLLTLQSQNCSITSVQATPLACDGYYFMVSIDLTVENPASPGFRLAGNGTIYGTFLYDDLPVVVGPFLGDNETTYEFIAWDVENGECQNFTTLAAANCGPICSFTNATLTFLQCQGDISATVLFDFDTLNQASVAFDLFYENGNQVGSYLYTSLPITIPFFIVNGANPITVTVVDQNEEDCNATFVFDAIDCEPDNCEFYNVSVDPNCMGSNFKVLLDFGIDNPASDSFTVTGNSINYGTFAYNDLPIDLGPLNGGTNINWQFQIRDTGDTTCQHLEVLGIYNCPPPCAMQSLMADAILCSGDTAYQLMLSLFLEGEGDNGFSVFSQSYYYGTLAYDSLPVTIPNYEGSGDFIDKVTVCDNENPGCCITAEYEALLCAGCIIYNLLATPLPCNDDDEYYVVIDFDYQNTSLEGFEVVGNGNNYGSFSYDELPVEVGPFPGDGSQFLEFVITDLQDPLCFASIELGIVTCDDICELSDLTVDTGECTGDDMYVALIDFNYNGVSGLGFDVFINGVFYNDYSYSSLPLTIEEFPSSGTGVDVLTVCDNDNPDCCVTLEFVAPDCSCEIYDATVEVLACSSDSTFAIAVEFFSANTPDNTVDVFIDGVYWGLFNAENIPIIIEDVPEGDGNSLLTICANDQNDCCVDVLIPLMLCDSTECMIWDLMTEIGDCTSDSTYVLDFVFDYINIPGDSITVTANGQNIGQYEIHPDFNRIENFPVLGNDTVHLVICAAGAPDCCDDVTYIAPDCSLFGQCQITELNVDLGDCTTDSTYSVHILFDFANLPTDSVTITANGNPLGNFQINEGHIIIEHFPEYDSATTHLVVCALGDPECCDDITFETPECLGENECHIYDLITLVGDCLSDSTYILYVFFEFDNLPTDSVVITANGNTMGTFQINEGVITLDSFPVYDENLTEITVCAAGAPDCCDEFVYETPDCTGGGTCHLLELVADAGGCTSDSTFELLILYFGNNFPVDSVNVTANGNFVGTFAHNPEGIAIEFFPDFGTEITALTLCVVGAPDCCDTYEFVTPDCGPGGCEIWDLVVIVGDCQSDSSYQLHIQFNYENLPGDSVVITANENDLGVFHVNEGSIVLDSFPVYDANQTVISVCALGAPDCCAVVEFETPDCEGGGICHLYDLVADPGDCNSDTTYSLFVHYIGNNFPVDSVVVTVNDLTIGTFAHHPEGILIDQVLASDLEFSHVTVCAVGAPDCCDTFEYVSPNCGGLACHIFDLTATMTECDSNGLFYFILDFEWENTGTEGFNVVGNGNNYGNFSYDNLPIGIGPFEEDDTDYEFLVQDAQHPDCFELIEVGMIDCTVGTEVVPEDHYQVLNNGTIPILVATRNVEVSIYNISGVFLYQDVSLQAGKQLVLDKVPDGMYIGMIRFESHRWPVKLIRTGY